MNNRMEQITDERQNGLVAEFGEAILTRENGCLHLRGGSMADPGSVSYLFARRGVVIVPKGSLSEDDVLGAVLDAGAEEVNDLGDSFEVVSAASDVVAVRTALQKAGLDYESAETPFLPSMHVELDENDRLPM